MKKTLLKTVIFFGFLSPIFADSDISEINERYLYEIERLEAICSELEAKTIPVTTEDMFCSLVPINQIAARYCIYQNLVNPNNELSIDFPQPPFKENGALYNVKVSIPCSMF